MAYQMMAWTAATVVAALIFAVMAWRFPIAAPDTA
jgi:hypothetical protein